MCSRAVGACSPRSAVWHLLFFVASEQVILRRSARSLPSRFWRKSPEAQHLMVCSGCVAYYPASAGDVLHLLHVLRDNRTNETEVGELSRSGYTWATPDYASRQARWLFGPWFQ